MPQISSNNIMLEYDEFGSPFSPAVVLIMGLGAQMVAWPNDFCQSIADAGYRVIRFDNRDIGLSQKFDGVRRPNILKLLVADYFKVRIKVPYSLDDMSKDTLGLLDALDIDQAHIVGASMGGMIAQLLTAKFPERVLSLTSLMSTSGNKGLPRTNKDVVKQMLSRPDGSNRENYINHAVKTFQMIGSPAYPRPKKAWYKLIEMMLERSYYPQGFHRQVAAVLSAGSRKKLLNSITTPTLIIHGTDDPLIKVEHGIDTAKEIPDAKLELIQGMGHDLSPRLIPQISDLIIDHLNLV